jgi:hypothetical protein
MPEMIEEKAQKACERLAEKHCREASKEHWEVEEIERRRLLKSTRRLAWRPLVRLQRRRKPRSGQRCQKAAEAKKAEGSKGKGPAEVSGSPRKVRGSPLALP